MKKIEELFENELMEISQNEILALDDFDLNLAKGDCGGGCGSN